MAESQSPIPPATAMAAQSTFPEQTPHGTDGLGGPELPLKSEGIGAGAIAGIACSGVIAAAGIILLAICLRSQWKKPAEPSTDGSDRIEFVEEKALERAAPGDDNRFPESQTGIWYDTQGAPVFDLAAPDEAADVMVIL
jgi:hypothetical protein